MLLVVDRVAAPADALEVVLEGLDRHQRAQREPLERVPLAGDPVGSSRAPKPMITLPDPVVWASADVLGKWSSDPLRNEKTALQRGF